MKLELTGSVQEINLIQNRIMKFCNNAKNHNLAQQYVVCSPISLHRYCIILKYDLIIFFFNISVFSYLWCSLKPSPTQIKHHLERQKLPISKSDVISISISKFVNFTVF